MRFEGGGAPRACSPREERVPLDGAETALLTTDEGGHFCLKLALPVDRYAIRLSTRGAPLLDPARLDLAFDLGREAVALTFDPAPRVLRTDGPVAVDVVAVVDEGSVRSAAPSLSISMTDERGARLGSATTNASGHATIVVPPESLGPPGIGELRLAFAGDTDHGPAALAVEVERRTRVELLASEASAGGGNPENGLPIDVVATAARGTTPTGAVEARVDDVVVGAAPLESGRARLVATFAAPPPAADGTASATVTVRYLPDAPWFEPGQAARVTLPIRGPGVWQKVPLILTAAAVAAFLLLGRLGGRVRRRQPPAVPARPPEPAAAQGRIERVGAAAAGVGWSGQVVDAHDGTPIEGAEVTIEAPGFARPEVLARTRTDAEGRFALPTARDAPGARISGEGPHHALVLRPLPPAGDLVIALVSRKRALLDRLVAWARGRGRPYDMKPEPTPGQVREVARDRNPRREEGTAEWADAVERAAFGAAPVDARTEEAIERLKP